MSLSSLSNNAFHKPHNATTWLTDATTLRSYLTTDKELTENNNEVHPDPLEDAERDNSKINQIWCKNNFKTSSKQFGICDIDAKQMSWGSNHFEEQVKEEMVQGLAVREEVDEAKEEEDMERADTPSKSEESIDSPSHHARRPMNAFLIFCKKHRPVVKEKFPSLENRGITKILGEWWALLESADKDPYTQLAKEYKDAFLSAHPNFKWYKLPAPPLRTLTTRPTVPTSTKPPPVSSPPQSAPRQSEFTPGKLADESQLGSLTSLLNNNYSPSVKNESCCKNVHLEKNNNNTEISPEATLKAVTPPKPLKKRINENFLVAKGVARNLKIEEQDLPSNLTNQDLMNKVVDNYFDKDDESVISTRKSGRSCKGKRYEQFMFEGKLLGNKKDARLIQQRFKSEPSADELNNKQENQTPILDLNNTIKRLAERTNVKLEMEEEEKAKRIRTISETSDSSKNSLVANFDLNSRISELPSLSYEAYVTRKRESKKRKHRSESDTKKAQKIIDKNKQLVGSKKRKNKQSITHLNKTDNVGLFALATLAEIAANTEKISE